MNTPFSQPHTPGQWLLSSVCWVAVLVGGWLLVSAWILDVPYNEKTPDEPLFFLGFFVAHGVLWGKALPGLKVSEKKGSWLEIIAFSWQVGLVAFQLLWLGLILLCLSSSYFYNPENLTN